MAITLIGDNLNQYGDKGRFETDRSTWGFASSLNTFTRSSNSKSQGLYSCAMTSNETKSGTGIHQYTLSKFEPKTGKKYVATVKIRTETTNPFATDNVVISLRKRSTTNAVEEIVTSKTIAEIKGAAGGDDFYQIESRFHFSEDSRETIYIQADLLSGDQIIAGSPLYIDEFSIYEYSDVAEPACDIAIDTANTVVTDETTPGASDGSITVANTGTPRTSLEYSKDGGTTWQSSNQFTGLAPAIYNVVIRESGDISCSAAQSFSVNSGSVAFDFTTAVTHETVSGAADGSIEVTTSGTGAPFTYSNDGGSTFQAGNTFSGLAPNTYVIVVKDVNGNTKSQNVTVNAGAVLFDNIYFSGNLIPYTRPQTANNIEQNYRIYNEVRVEDVTGSGIYEKKMASTLEPDADGNATFNLRPAFRDVLTATAPLKNASEVIRLTDRLKLYKNFYGDVDDNKTVPDFFFSSNPFLIVMGGIDNRRYPDIDYFKNYLPNNKKFMTWAPREQEVDRYQEAYLNYFVFDPATNKINVNIKAYFDDNTNISAVHSSKTGVSYGEIYQVPAGPNHGGALLVDPAKTLIKYELWLTDQADAVISETMIYKLTPFRVATTRYIMFLNSLGSYDVVRFTGVTEERAEVGKEIIEKYLKNDYSALDGQYEMAQGNKNLQTVYSSGFFKGKYGKEYAYYMQDLLLSRRVFDITTGERIPIVINGSTFKLSEDKDRRYYLRMEASDAWSDNVYTPKTLPNLGE